MSYENVVKDCVIAALNLVMKERIRQRQKFDYDHDDQHVHGEILTASNLIAMDVGSHDDNCILDDDGEDWMHDLALHVRAKYGQNYKQRLVIAAAMMLAEIERLERLEKSGEFA